MSNTTRGEKIVIVDNNSPNTVNIVAPNTAGNVIVGDIDTPSKVIKIVTNIPDDRVKITDAAGLIETIRIVTQPAPSQVRVTENLTPAQVIRVVSAGPPGGKGERGPAGPTGSVPPFYLVGNSTDFATTSSLSLYGTISSSIQPSTLPGTSVGAFSLGSPSTAWKDIYLGTGSIYFVDGGEIVGNIAAQANKLIFGNTTISTSSFGFDSNPIIIRNSATNSTISLTGSMNVEGSTDSDILTISSGSSNALKVDSSGRLILGNYQPGTILPVDYGIVFIDGELHVGK